jgi:DNA-binding CsgD family transcriptional regulator
MNEIAPKLVNGFSPENVERIYRGLPALVEGKEPADVLTDAQFETLSLVADGLCHEEIAEVINTKVSTVYGRNQTGRRRLGVAVTYQLAGFFPLGVEHELVQGKILADLEPGRLDTFQGLSTGLSFEQLANETYTFSTRRRHASSTSKIWPDVQGGIVATAVISALRTKYIRVIEGPSQDVECEDMGIFSLPELVEVEPAVLRIIEAQAAMAEIGIDYPSS